MAPLGTMPLWRMTNVLYALLATDMADPFVQRAKVREAVTTLWERAPAIAAKTPEDRQREWEQWGTSPEAQQGQQALMSLLGGRRSTGARRGTVPADEQPPRSGGPGDARP